MPPRAMKRRMRKRLAMVSPGENADCGVGGCGGRGGAGDRSSSLMRARAVDGESRVSWLRSSSGGLRGESSVGMGVVSEGDYATRGRVGGRERRRERTKVGREGPGERKEGAEVCKYFPMSELQGKN